MDRDLRRVADPEARHACTIAAAIIGGAVVSTAGSAIASGNATSAAANAAAQNNALESQIYNSNKTLEQPYIDRGNAAGDELNGFLGLSGDPAQSQAALNTYLNSTGYNFDRSQGLAGVNQSAASEGLFNSGAALKALDTYATGEAEKYGQDYASDLAGVSGTGASASNALAGFGANYAGAVSSNNNNAATVAGNADVAGAANTNNLISNAIKAAGSFNGTNAFGSTSFGGGDGQAAVNYSVSPGAIDDPGSAIFSAAIGG